MRRVIATAFMVGALLALAPTAASAGERLFDGALGAASGALLFGAPGFVAGGVIGYAACPRLSRGLGFPPHYRYGYRRFGSYRRLCDPAPSVTAPSGLPTACALPHLRPHLC